MFRITKKRSCSSSNSESPKISIENIEIFKNLNVYVLANGMGKNRAELFRNSLAKYGATLIDENKELDQKEFEKNIVLVDENTIKTWANLEKALNKKLFYTSIKKQLSDSNLSFHVITSLWLTECLKQKCLIDTKDYELLPEAELKSKNDTTLKRSVNTVENSDSEDDDKAKNSKKYKKIALLNSNEESSNDSIKTKPFQVIQAKAIQKESDLSDYSDSDEENNSHLISNQVFFENELRSKTKLLFDSKSWTCAHSSKEQSINHNKHITDKLEAMSSIYENTKDKYRALGYQKAILILKRHPTAIKSREEAINLSGVGRRIADKIWEILQTGDLRKLDELNSREDINSIQLFTLMHGVGPATAQSFVAQGYRTLDDLRTKASLTRQQKIGLKYYDEFTQRISREEAVKIEQQVKDAALSLNPGLIVQACGSYRRGKATCGDVDVLITHPDGHSHKNIFNKLIEILHDLNFLTDDLVIQDENADSHRKYLGVCRLPHENSIHRRLDIIVVPFDEYACALLYFTGSAHFNRSMRHLAAKLGLSLTEKSLNKNVIRKGTEKIIAGERIQTQTEEDVFKLLNIPYRSPEERDF